jgi:hypothetical protein
VEAPWNHNYLSKPFAVNLCDLSKSASVVVVGTVLKTSPFDDPGGYFANSPNGGNGKVTLVEVALDTEFAGSMNSKTFTVEVPGRAFPVPDTTAPSTMVPDIMAGERAVFFLVPNSKNSSYWILRYGWEAYFPVGSSGKVSNGYVQTHPPKELASFINEVEATIQAGKNCVGNLDIYKDSVDAGASGADGKDGSALSDDEDAVAGTDLKP